MITPVLGSSGPGQQMPTPLQRLLHPESAAFAHTWSMAFMTVASPAVRPVVRQHGNAGVIANLSRRSNQSSGDLAAANIYADDEADVGPRMKLFP